MGDILQKDNNPQEIQSDSTAGATNAATNGELGRSVADVKAGSDRTELLRTMNNSKTTSEEARQYNQESLRLSLFDKAIDFAYLGIAALFLAKPYEAYLATFAVLREYEWLRLIVLILSLFLLHFVISLPLSYISGFKLEHKYLLSRQSFGGWARKLAKQMVLVALVDVMSLTGLFYIIKYCGWYWIPLATILFFLVGIVFGIILPVIILPLFYKIERLDDSILLGRLKKLTDGSTLNIEGVYRMNLSAETVKANAMLAGIGPSRRVILGDTLLEYFELDEIETVFAHEMGHHVHAHIMKLIPIGVLFSLIAFFLCDSMIRWQAGFSPWGTFAPFSVSAAPAAVFSYQTLPLWTIIAIKFFLSILFMLYEPLSNGISRHFERQADAYALASVGSDAYVRTFTKLSVLNKADPDPPAWEVFWFYSHPPIYQRIAMAKEVA